VAAQTQGEGVRSGESRQACGHKRRNGEVETHKSTTAINHTALGASAPLAFYQGSGVNYAGLWLCVAFQSTAPTLPPTPQRGRGHFNRIEAKAIPYRRHRFPRTPEHR
jgi:hypothetical protein